jgi:hypothetical protein
MSHRWNLSLSKQLPGCTMEATGLRPLKFGRACIERSGTAGFGRSEAIATLRKMTADFCGQLPWGFVAEFCRNPHEIQTIERKQTDYSNLLEKNLKNYSNFYLRSAKHANMICL